ncbi:DUF1289 domain-containing protein [Oceanicoccus sagamiensis]|uniref:DUF1289 domain-containing protein n=1 Tax=Oceanicoccus sagamiensis TaxID=716816 RepID=A0A1X9NID5_9GAMM|nr:DUF1289 domain-containing protein [Oceanicoccus sagamiensis]ARN73743.1 hypothetical protein BST96_06210 [Oceanicoccus sagamiensis]
MSINAVLIEETTQDNNPCVRNCCLDDTKVCMGCGRSLAEILEWHNADSPRQQQISQRAKQRMGQRPGF